MKRYAKSKAEYKDIEFEEKKITEAAKRLKAERKKPTSVALELKTVNELKHVAAKMDIPYQVLMRMFIVEGLRKAKRNVL